MTMDIELRWDAAAASRCARVAGDANQGASYLGGGRAGGGADDQEVRPHAGAHRRRDGAGRAVPLDLPLRVRRRRGPHGDAERTSTSWCRASS